VRQKVRRCLSEAAANHEFDQEGGKPPELLEFLFMEHFEEFNGQPTLEKLDALFLRSPQRFEKTVKKFEVMKTA
jgi:hypothetical protein